jgi:hypothetical protein
MAAILVNMRRGKAYGSVKLKSKSRKTTTPWRYVMNVTKPASW